VPLLIVCSCGCCGCCGCCCCLTAFSCGAIGDDGGGDDDADDNDLLLVLPTGAIVAIFAPVVTETVLVLFVVAICCCFGAAAAVGFVGVVCFGVVDDTAADDVDGVTADDVDDFIVFGIPHISDSVVLTALRLGLLGLHIFALSSGDIIVLLPPAGDDDGWKDAAGIDGKDKCCAYT
jgi:hypothetical protein